MLLLSGVLFYFAENQINYTLIHTATIVFLISAVSLIWKDIKNKDFITFNILFSFSFFLCSYAYVLFVMDTPFWDLDTWATHMVDFNYATRGVTLSTVSYCVYCLGFTFYNKRITPDKSDYRLQPYNFKSLFIIASIALSANVISAVMLQDTINITSSPFISVFFNIALCMSLVSNSAKTTNNKSLHSFLKNNKIELIVCLFLSLLYLYTGDRGFPIFVSIVIVFVFSHYYKKVNLSILLTLLASSAFLMFAIRETRNSEDSIKKAGVSSMFDASSQNIGNKPVILVFSDLLGANSELCTGLEYVDHYGYYQPGQILLLPLTPFPLLPSIGASLMYGSKDYTSLLASSVLNEFTVNNYGSRANWGNHVTIDIYYRWGLIGVLAAFFFFGILVSRIIKMQNF